MSAAFAGPEYIPDHCPQWTVGARGCRALRDLPRRGCCFVGSRELCAPARQASRLDVSTGDPCGAKERTILPAGTPGAPLRAARALSIGIPADKAY